MTEHGRSRSPGGRAPRSSHVLSGAHQMPDCLSVTPGVPGQLALVHARHLARRLTSGGRFSAGAV